MGMGNDPINSTDPDGGYSRFGAWIRSGFGLRGEIYQSGVDGNKEVWGFNTGSGENFRAHFGEDARNNYKDAPAIQARHDNFFGEIRKSTLGQTVIGEWVYEDIDDLFVTLQIGDTRRNLEGFGVSGNEITDAGAGSIGLITLGYNPYKGITAPQVSSFFKGSIINQLNKKSVGLSTRIFNFFVTKRQNWWIENSVKSLGNETTDRD